jgi:NAD(P)-dependent dehydrogenase (short-subunit alcohol dehydrogenase family)
MSIGRAISLTFAREGGTVGVLDLSLEAAAGTVAEIEKQGGRAFPVNADAAVEADGRRAVREVLDRAGRLDVLVNNVGVTAGGRVTEVEESEWDRVIAVNLKSALLMSKHALPAMVHGGSIVNISSIASLRPRSATVYAVSKAALETLTRATAVQYGAQGVRANAVLPGEVWTELMARVYPGERGVRARESRLRNSLLGTEGTAWDVASATLFLASDEARWITGQTLVVDGGFTLRDPRDGTDAAVPSQPG